MKIISFEELTMSPSGTIFAPWEPSTYNGEFEIKLDASKLIPHGIGMQWYFNGVVPIIPHCDPEIEEPTFSFCPYDGSVIDYNTFAVLEDKDIDDIITLLLWARNGCIGPCNIPGMED